MCGASSRDQIAPGFWECTGLIKWTEYVPAPGVPPMFNQTVPVERSRVCANRYHEADSQPSGAAQCACRTYAIGTCAQCDRPVCGDHSRMSDGSRVCLDCLTAQKEAKEQAERQRALEREQEAAQQREISRLSLPADCSATALELDGILPFDTHILAHGPKDSNSAGPGGSRPRPARGAWIMRARDDTDYSDLSNDGLPFPVTTFRLLLNDGRVGHMRSTGVLPATLAERQVTILRDLLQVVDLRPPVLNEMRSDLRGLLRRRDLHRRGERS